MAIQLNILAKQCVLIAALCIAELIFWLVDGLWGMVSPHNTVHFVSPKGYEDYEDMNSNFVAEEEENNYSKLDRSEVIRIAQAQYKIDIGLLIVYVVGIFVSALMIFGILKKHKNLMAPWIIVYGLCVVAGVSYCIYSFIALRTTTSVFRAVEVFNIGCLILYPVVMLFKQMHHEEVEIKKLQCQLEVQAADASCHPKFNPYFIQTVERKVETEL